jgi:hypothetical protein
MVNPIFGSLNNSLDGFVAKFSPDCLSLLFSTFLGGSDSDRIVGVAADPSGGIHLAGITTSYDLPLVNPIFTQYGGGGDDGFAAKISPSLDSLNFCSYIGGSGIDRAFCVEADADGNSYFAGQVLCDIPLRNPVDSIRGAFEGFILGIDSNGDSLIYGTYFGGSGGEVIHDIYFDSDDNMYLSGSTSSTNLPLMNPYDSTYNLYSDCFVALISNSGDSLIFSTYIGGSGEDQGYGITADNSGGIYVNGFTNSTDFPMVNPCFESYDNAYDGFVAKFGSTYPCPYVVGDANGSGQANGLDVMYLVNYFKGGSAPPVLCDCTPYGQLYLGADANGSCSVNGLDVSYMVNYYKGGPLLKYCSDCPPSG